MNKRENQILLEALIKRKIVNLKELKNFSKNAQNSINSEGISQTIIKFFNIEENVLDNIIAEEFNIPFLYSTDSLQWVDVPDLPAEASAKYRFIPIIVEDLELTVAFIDPPYPRLIELLENTTHRQIVPVIISPSAFDVLLMHKSKGTKKQVSSRFDFEVIDVKKRGEKWASSKETAHKLPSSNSVFAKIIDAALENEVSHIHMETTPKGFLKTSFRIKGVLFRVVTLPVRYSTQIPSMIKQLAKIETFQSDHPIQGNATFKIRDQKINADIFSIPTSDSEKITIKILDTKKELLNIEEIGLSEHDKPRFNHIISKTASLIVFSGPSDSGKTTTMYSILNKINSEERNIFTIDLEKVEVNIKGLKQLTYFRTGKMTLTELKDNLYKHNLDILAIDKIDSATSLNFALDTVMRDVQTFTTINARNSIDALFKMINTGVSIEKISLALGGIVSQKLVRKVCPVCGEKYKPEKELLEYMGILNLPEDISLTKGSGCQKCLGTGYLGLIPLFETLIITDEMCIMLSRGCTVHELKKVAIENGFTDLRYDGLRKAIIGITTLDEVLRQTQ